MPREAFGRFREWRAGRARTLARPCAAGRIAGVAFLAYAELGSRAGIVPHLAVASLYVVLVELSLRALNRRRAIVVAAGGPSLLVAIAIGIAAVGFSAVAFWTRVPDVRVLDLLRVSLGAAFIVLATRLLAGTADARPQRVLIVGEAGVPGLLGVLGEVRRRDVEVTAVWTGDRAEFLGRRRGSERLTLLEVVERVRPDLVVVAVQHERQPVFEQVADVAHHRFRVLGLPEFYEHFFGRLPVQDLTPAWFMSVLHLYQQPYGRIAKRVFDVVVASAAILLTLPAFAFAAALVATSGRPIIFRQVRLGENGRYFTIFKFRSMRIDAESFGAIWASRNDPRTTRVGGLLRKLRLDELPQLVNVLRGEMSIVGPRPERPEFLPLLEQKVPFWTRRHLLKPGITGWAQISGDYASDERETESKLSYDLWYLRHGSLVVDLMICLRTIPRMLSGGGAR